MSHMIAADIERWQQNSELAGISEYQWSSKAVTGTRRMTYSHLEETQTFLKPCSKQGASTNDSVLILGDDPRRQRRIILQPNLVEIPERPHEADEVLE